MLWGSGAASLCHRVRARGQRHGDVVGRLRLGASVVEERTLVQRNSNLPVVLWRQRNALPPAVAPVTAVE